MRPYNSILSPRGVHKHFPAWRDYREYAGGGHADMGAHHYDIAQWCLGMDDSGPVEIIPPLDRKAGHGVVYRYANGVIMIHGGPSGCTFTGTEGTLRIDRDHLSSDPGTIVKEPLKSKDVHLRHSPGHHRDWLDCIRSRKRPVADVEIGARSVAIHDPRQPRLLEPCCAALGPEEMGVRRRARPTSGSTASAATPGSCRPYDPGARNERFLVPRLRKPNWPGGAAWSPFVPRHPNVSRERS